MIAVVTAPREGVSYLEATLESIDSSARDANRIVFLDGDGDVALPSSWRLERAPKPANHPRQNKWTAWAAITRAAAMNEDLLFFEDDIKLCKNGSAHAESVRVPADVALVTFYAPFGDLTMQPGIWRGPMGQFGYAQALKFPARTCVELHRARQEMADGRFGTTDGMLREMGRRRSWHYGVHYPGIVQHRGATSLVGPGGKLVGHRVSHAYPGDQFDARSLLLQDYT